MHVRASQVKDFCYVVNNPYDFSHSFCLPVLVITYLDAAVQRTLSFHPWPKVPIEWDDAPKIVASNAPAQGAWALLDKPWSAMFRWHWKQDGGKMEPYNDEINSLLERHFENYTRQGGPDNFTTPELVRYLDDKPQKYHIDFVASRQVRVHLRAGVVLCAWVVGLGACVRDATASLLRCVTVLCGAHLSLVQTNCTTSFQRSIERRKMPAEKHARTWQFFSEVGWRPFESLVQNQIERAFKQYTDGTGASFFDMQTPGRPEVYRLDFVKGEQLNTQSQERRKITR